MSEISMVWPSPLHLAIPSLAPFVRRCRHRHCMLILVVQSDTDASTAAAPADTETEAVAPATPTPAPAPATSAAPVASPVAVDTTRYHFLGDASTTIEDQLAVDIARSGAFSLEQLTAVVSSVLDCLKSPAVRPVAAGTRPSFAKTVRVVAPRTRARVLDL
jgi:hypothetical protein